MVEHYDRASALHNAAGQRIQAASQKVQAAAAGLRAWTEEDERKHPRNKGQFASKPGAGSRARCPSPNPKAQDPPPEKPSGQISIGGRAFEILKKGKKLALPFCG